MSERASLTAHDEQASYGATDGLHRRPSQHRPGKGTPTVARSALKLVKLALPSAVSVLLYYTMQFVSMAVVGTHLPPAALAGNSIAFFGLSCIALYPGMGLCCAVDTLCSQIFGQEPDSPLQGVITQRSILMTTLYCTPMAVLLQYTEQPLKYFYADDVAESAATWLAVAPLYLFAQLYCLSMNKFLACMMKPYHSTAALAVGAVAVVPLSKGLVESHGVAGGAVAMGLATLCELAALLVIVFVLDKEARHRFGPIAPLRQLLAWDEVKVYLGLGLPSMLFVAAEASAFDAAVLIAGLLPPAEASGWSTVMTTMLLFQSVSAGFSIAATALVGSSVGAGKPGLAKRYAVLAPSMTFVASCCTSVFVLAFHGPLFSIMSNNAHVGRVVDRLLIFIPGYHILDSVQYVFQGVYSGCGRNGAGAKVLLGSLWLVGVPVMWLLTERFGVQGIPMGLTIGLGVELPLLIVVAWKSFDWLPVLEHDSFEHVNDVGPRAVSHVNLDKLGEEEDDDAP